MEAIGSRFHSERLARSCMNRDKNFYLIFETGGYQSISLKQSGIRASLEYSKITKVQQTKQTCRFPTTPADRPTSHEPILSPLPLPSLNLHFVGQSLLPLRISDFLYRLRFILRCSQLFPRLRFSHQALL